jgi:hypothetical protein
MNLPAKISSLKPFCFIRIFQGTGIIAVSTDPTSIAAIRTEATPMTIKVTSRFPRAGKTTRQESKQGQRSPYVFRH